MLCTEVRGASTLWCSCVPLFQAQLETSQSDAIILRRQVEALQSEAKALTEQVGLILLLSAAV